MKRVLLSFMSVAISLGLMGLSVNPLIAEDIVADAPKITKEELKSKLGDPDLIIIDVLVQDQWETVDQKLPGVVHENPEEVDSWANKYKKDKTYVLY